jgi:hypothetical protein
MRQLCGTELRQLIKQHLPRSRCRFKSLLILAEVAAVRDVDGRGDDFAPVARTARQQRVDRPRFLARRTGAG